MKAIRIHEFGPTEEVLRYEDVPTPEPAADEILIKVEAASLNRADLGLRKGTYRVSADELPIIPGREFANAIAKIGPANSRPGMIGSSSAETRYVPLRNPRSARFKDAASTLIKISSATGSGVGTSSYRRTSSVGPN